MIHKLQINIPEPCHEKWSEMTPQQKGRFCAMCQKTVYDFTKSSDREIINAYNKNEKLCGRFLTSQLDRDLILPKERKSYWLATVFFGFFTFWNIKSTAQQKPNTEQTEIKEEIQGKIVQHRNKEKEITGNVSDSVGPLPGVTIFNKSKNTKTFTDLEGKYSIRAEYGDILEYSFVGMNEIRKSVGDSNTINTILIDSFKALTGVVVVTKKKTFVGRTLRKIGNWFR